ncbi:hypothetical protein HY500_00440 [Candidatus Woesearchaeota archaeon]|nr:hypothetical protein [Candidatus Woesearchaeota archaeon]
MKNKEKRMEGFEQLMAELHTDLTKPYDSCKIKKDIGSIVEVPVTYDPNEFAKRLCSGEFPDKRGFASYSHTFDPKLTELLEAFEDSPLGKGTWSKGEVRPEFRDALRLLDDYAESEDEWILAENLAQKRDRDYGSLTLMSGSPFGNVGISCHPHLWAVRYVQGTDSRQDTPYDCEFHVDIIPSRAIKIGEDYIIPDNYKPISLRESRLDERMKGEIVFENFKLHSDRKEIDSVLKKVAKGHMFKAVKQVMGE